MFRDQAAQDYPNHSNYDLNRDALIYYNRGRGGGKKFINNKGKGYDY